MTTTSYKVADGLYLVRQPLPAASVTKTIEVSTHHVVVLDCSGSMGGELPKIREQLKKKLPKLLKEGDTLSMIWFSGRGQCGILLKGEEIAGLADLATVSTAIDRWLKPVGMTGFVEPIKMAAELAAASNVKSDWVRVNALFFMSDGCDNQSSRTDVIKAIENAAGEFASATFVEYGYYADRPLLTAMAEKAGGTLIFADQFDKYEPLFEAAMQKQPPGFGSRKVEVWIKPPLPHGGFVWTQDGDELTTYAVDANQMVLVPEGTEAVHFLSSISMGAHGVLPLGGAGDLRLLAFATDAVNMMVNVDAIKHADQQKQHHVALAPAYAALSLFSTRMKPEIVYPILRALADVRFIKLFSTCFGKQKYSAFMDLAKAAAREPNLRFVNGRDEKALPKDDAFTILDLLKLLEADDENRVLLDSPYFKYSRIGRGKVAAEDSFTPEEQARLDAVTERMKKAKGAAQLKKLSDEFGTTLSSILQARPLALEFDGTDQHDGYSVMSLTYNEERPNVSILVKRDGVVDLAGPLGRGEIPKLKTPITPNFETFIWRNYAIIKDGLVNVDVLPVRVTGATFQKLIDADLVSPVPNTVKVDDQYFVNLDLTQLAVINRKMTKEVSAKQLFDLEYALTVGRARQKVFNAYQKELAPEKKDDGYEALYGPDAAAWLKERGFSSGGGFSPKVVQADSTDVYMGKQLDVSLKGYASLPSVADVKKRSAGGKALTGGAKLMQDAIVEVETFFAGTPKPALRLAWIEGVAKATKAAVRSLLFQKAQIVYTIVVGQVWFKEFTSIDENTMTIHTVDGPVVGTVQMKEIEIKI